MNVLLTLVVLAQAAAGAPPPGQPSAPAVHTAVQAVSSAQPGSPAATGTADRQGRPEGGMWSTLIFFGVMILVFWLLIIRPQQKQKKKQEAFLSALKPGDKVLTSGGMVGRVVTVAGNVVTLEVAKNVRIKVVKGHIAGNFIEEAETAAKT